MISKSLSKPRISIPSTGPDTVLSLQPTNKWWLEASAHKRAPRRQSRLTFVGDSALYSNVIASKTVRKVFLSHSSFSHRSWMVRSIVHGVCGTNRSCQNCHGWNIITLSQNSKFFSIRKVHNLLHYGSFSKNSLPNNSFLLTSSPSLRISFIITVLIHID